MEANPNPTDGGGFVVAPATPAFGPPTKRSVTIAGHETSVGLEPLFWQALEQAAIDLGLPLNALIARIDAERLESHPPPNLASAIRQRLLARLLADR